MSSKQDQSPVAKHPKAIGLSKRLIITIIAVILFIMILFLFFITGEGAKAHPRHSDIRMLLDQDSSIAQIKKIENESPHSVLVGFNNPGKRRGDTHLPFNVGTDVTNGNAFQAGSNAPISVYHRPAAISPTSHSSSAYPTDLHTTPVPGFNSPSVNPYQMQNMQSEKRTFLNNAQQQRKDYIRSKLQLPLSPYEIKAGTIIPATLMTGVHSTLPGTIIAKVRRDVFDSVSGNDCLIPQGSTLLGTYDSQIAYGQSRVLIVWSRLIFPNGSSFDLNGMPGADLTGMAGLHDQVNHHYFRLFSSATLLSLFGALGQLSQPNNNNHLSTQQVLYAAIGQQMSQTAMQLMAKNMNIQPTLTIRPGTNFNVLLTRDMVLSGAYHF